MDKKISIVMPNFDGRTLMERNLPSVIQALRAYEPGGELIIVDDGSKDGSVGWLERTLKEGRVMVHEKNRGFASACTTGLENAAFETVILLNTDVEVHSDFILPLVEALAGNHVFAVGCLALAGNGLKVGENLKIPKISFGKLKYKKLAGLSVEEYQKILPRPIPTLFATGGFLALKKSLFFSLGGFDPLYEPFYYEDADLCYRAWKRGFSVLFEPKSVVTHHHVGTILSLHGTRRVRRIQERNRLLLLWKNLTAPRLFLKAHLAPLLIRCLTKWIVLDLDFYYALFGALRRLKPVLAARKKETKEAVRNDLEIFEEIRKGASFL